MNVLAVRHRGYLGLPVMAARTDAAEDHRGEAGLPLQISRYFQGSGDPSALMTAVRAAVLLVPVHGTNALLTGLRGGLCWVYGFTSEAELAEFAVQRETGDQEWHYVTALGSRVLDEFLPALTAPCGLAVDVAGTRAMTFPPVRGVVADGIALDTAGGAR